MSSLAIFLLIYELILIPNFKNNKYEDLSNQNIVNTIENDTELKKLRLKGTIHFDDNSDFRVRVRPYFKNHLTYIPSKDQFLDIETNYFDEELALQYPKGDISHLEIFDASGRYILNTEIIFYILENLTNR
ncbi:MAG: hypothetical protein IPL55_00180 [Saprospiraceae bacterium]|nr:hypothetical protein [Saprospiraceae bacterium]